MNMVEENVMESSKVLLLTLFLRIYGLLHYLKLLLLHFFQIESHLSIFAQNKDEFNKVLRVCCLVTKEGNLLEIRANITAFLPLRWVFTIALLYPLGRHNSPSWWSSGAAFVNVDYCSSITYQIHDPKSDFTTSTWALNHSLIVLLRSLVYKHIKARL